MVDLPDQYTSLIPLVSSQTPMTPLNDHTIPTNVFQSSSFLHAKVNVIDPQRRKVLVGSLYVEQQPSKAHEYLSIADTQLASISYTSKTLYAKGLIDSHILVIPLLKSIYLPMTNVIISICHTALPHTNVSPPLPIILTPIYRQCRR